MFAELRGEEEEIFRAKVGLDDQDWADEEIQELLGVYNEVKHGLDEGDEEDGE